MRGLTLDDFEWVEHGFDHFALKHKAFEFNIAVIGYFDGWLVRVHLDPSDINPLHVISLDAAKSIAQITATQYMEKYYARMRNQQHLSKRTKREGPPKVREGVFKVD